MIFCYVVKIYLIWTRIKIIITVVVFIVIVIAIIIIIVIIIEVWKNITISALKVNVWETLKGMERIVGRIKSNAAPKGKGAARLEE